MRNALKTLLNSTYVTVLAITLVGCLDNNKEKNWNETVNQVSSGVVSIQSDVPIAFDGKWNRSSYGTGFIVDATRGIILTNRHIVTPGPSSAKAILINNEEINLTPLYIDPVHDFGFFQYDPAHIKHLQPHEFKLSDNPPKVGDDIRVIGNDAGQKISILDGTISRLDREAPFYGKGHYNDFNIYYIQAATSTSGGSSGSPVVNIKGEAVALNAGSQTDSANAFYLPLEQVKRALKLLQNKQEIPRGTLKTTFSSTPYTELKRIGLSGELETQFREQYPNLKGLLVARLILPNSHAADVLQVGDVLLQVNQDDVINYTQLENALNNAVNQNITLKVLRQGKPLTFDVTVDDLHALSPNALVNFDGSTFHTLSYQQARHFNKPIKGVYVTGAGGSFAGAGVPTGSVITEFNGANVSTVEEFNKQLTQIANEEKVNVRYFDFATPNTTNYRLVEINRKWFTHSYCVKSAELDYWPCQEQQYQAQHDEAELSNLVENFLPVDSQNIEHALVNVNFNSPYSIQGRSGDRNSYGTGVIVDIQQGWIIVPRSVVFSMLGDVKITFNNRFEVNGKIEYIHPLHNLALISYQPHEVNNAKVSQVTLSTKKVNNGDPIVQMGLNYDGIVEYRQTFVDTTEEFWLRQFNVPQFVDKNIDATHLVNPNTAIDGVLLNQQNEVTGIWAVFDAADDKGKSASNSIAGLSSAYILDLLATFKNKKPVYSLDIGLTMIPPVNALQMGLDETWLNKINQRRPNSNKLLAIYNVSKYADSFNFLKRGDILLAIDGDPVSSFKQVEDLIQKPQVNVTYFSEGHINTSTIETTALNGNDIERVIYWSGLYLHAPHRAALVQGNINNSGVYVASYKYGSPAQRYGLYAMRRIVEIDGKAIVTLDDFIDAVKDKPHQASVVIKTIDFDNKPSVIALKVNNHYWPLHDLKYTNGEWQKTNYPLSLIHAE